MILYRPHRGSLEDSMKEVKEVNSMQELIEVIKSEFTDFGFEEYILKNGIEIIEYCYDKRIDWNTHIVRYTGANEKFVIGFTNGNFNEGEK